MITESGRKSAKIYSFPAGGRPRLRTERVGARVVDLRPMPGFDVVSGAAWYHEAAIRETDQPRKA